MILALSTSSAQSSVAVFQEDGRLVWKGEELAPRQASAACMRLIQESRVELSQVDWFLADIGPGSFTGVRVGVVLAKTLAYVQGAKCGGADAFDLISPAQTVAFPSRKGEWFVREPGKPAIRTQEEPIEAVGFGFGGQEVFPHAARFEALLGGLERQDPVAFVPVYQMEPSISIPKKPYAGGVA